MNYINDYKALQNFVLTHENWESDLKKAPYFLKIKRAPYNDNWVMFTYNIFDTDFSLPEVRAARGSIFELPSMKPICLPFYVFRNWNEPCHDDIDWSSAKVELKVDGSLIKCVKHNGEIHWFTNGNTFTESPLMLKWTDCDEPGTKNAKTYRDLIDYAVSKEPSDWIKNIPEDYTFMFELTSGRNVIIVPFKETKFWFLGCRNNNTFEEIDRDEAKNKWNIPFDVPPVIPANNFSVVQEEVAKWTGDKEGVVVVDKNFRRIKVKTDFYLNLKYNRDAASISLKAVYSLIRSGKIDDALSLTPELKDRTDFIMSKIRHYDSNVWNKVNEGRKALQEMHTDRKLFAEKYHGTPCMLALYSDDRVNEILSKTSWLDFRDAELPLEE